MTARRLRVGLVGCGQVADAHLEEIRKIPSAELVAVCDRERDLAQQAAARFEVPHAFDDLDAMLGALRPDVVHVTTPPHIHKRLAIQVLRSGSHAYVEKPFAVDLAEADEILQAAESAGRMVCVGHDHLFDPAWEECRDMYRRGELGEIVHIDSVQGYDLSGPFGALVMGDPGHWIHDLPGGIFHNTISHAVYKITEFLPDEQPQISGMWFSAPNAGNVRTELRVMLRGANVTASLTASCAARPVQRLARIYGTRQTVEVDLDGQLLRTYSALRWRGPFAKLEAPYRLFGQARQRLQRAARRFLKNELHFWAGMGRLVSRFYDAILENGEPPIPYGEIRRVTAIMDGIFASCEAQQQENAPAECPVGVLS